jgi:hypothetical protein
MENTELAKPSQGDWFFSSNGGEIISMPLQVKICSRVSGANYQEGIANGMLMAAAPELLLAVKACYNFLNSDSEFDEAPYQQIKDALSKAGFPIAEYNASEDWDNLPF